ncbi:MAG: peptide chain release factor N(5)-glutamine methyltransferase [Ruminococcaceae bacterium]|nr:peptide chain release factor N(5)-glutamine methyltransferase [Oscillospiraceae bacterium]
MNDKDIIKDFYKNEKNSEKLISEALSRLDSGEPAAYIIGEWYFWRYTFKLNKSCLIPRPDTEIIVEKAISEIPKNSVFADLCTGSGCIALSILGERPDLRAVAYDISEEALEAAKENAKAIGVSDRIEFTCCDLLKESSLGGRLFGAIVSNPPYIRTDVISDYPDLSYEPHIALDGGEDGLVFYRHFVSKFSKNLAESAPFIFEIGFDQASEIEDLAKSCGFECKITKDYGGNDRAALLKIK